MSELQPTRPMGASPESLMSTPVVGTEGRYEILELFGKRVKVVPEAIRDLWSHQLANVEVVKNLASLKAGKFISEEAFTLLIRKFQDGSPSMEGLDGRIAKSDLEFVASVVRELKEFRTAEEVSTQIDRALFLGDVAKLRSLHRTGRLGSGLVTVNTSADRVKLILAAFAGRRDAMIQLQVPAAPQVTWENRSDAFDSPRHATEVRSVPQQSVNLQAGEPRPVVPGSKETLGETKRPSSPTMALVATGQTSSEGNPLYALQFFQDGRLVGQFRMVSGKASTDQDRRSHGDPSSAMSEAEHSTSREGEASTNFRSHGSSGGARWFIGALPSNNEGRPGLDAHTTSGDRKKNHEEGTVGSSELTSRGVESSEFGWLADSGNADATEMLADLQ